MRSCRGSARSGSCCRCSRSRLLVRRWRRASAPERRAGAPVLWAGSAMFAALAFSVANDIFDHPLGPGPAWTRELVFASIPIAVLAALLQRRLARGAVAGLVVELGEGATAVDLRECARPRARRSLAASSRTGFPRAAATSTPTASRSSCRSRSPGGQRPSSSGSGEPIAALIHDPALAEDKELVQSVCAAAALTLENARLQAELRARLAELQASRARLVEATEIGTAADRARPARRHTAAARLDRDDPRPRRVEARGRPTGGPARVCARRATRSRSRSRSCAS